ncbi:MAG: hypothetical protein WKF71_10300 [Pyrinomonadaceae bacterium]
MALVDKFFNKILGSNTDRYLKKINPIVGQVNALEPSVQKLSDDELKGRTVKFKEQIQKALEGIEDKAERRKKSRKF